MIPGARGCTPQIYGFRNHSQELVKLEAAVSRLSTQTIAYQREMGHRLGLWVEIFSDAEFQRCDALRLPTFEVQGMRLVKRLTLMIGEGHVVGAIL